MMMRGGRTFLDTNVLLRLMIETAPLHHEALTLIAAQNRQNAELWISRQVLREYLVQVTRPQSFMAPLSGDEIDKHIQKIIGLFNVADENADITSQLIVLLKETQTGGKQVHDANIVATMLVYEIDTLLTTNIEDMKRFVDRVQVIALTAS